MKVAAGRWGTGAGAGTRVEGECGKLISVSLFRMLPPRCVFRQAMYSSHLNRAGSMVARTCGDCGGDATAAKYRATGPLS